MTIKISWSSGTLELDSLISETLSESAVVTTSPVEKGFATSDGVTQSPSQLKIEAIVSDRNIKGSTTATRLVSGKAEAARRQLKTLMASGTLLKIETDSRLYENYVLRTLDSPREGKPDTIQFAMSFVEIRVVETQSRVHVGSGSNASRAPEMKEKSTSGKTQGIQETKQSALAKGVDLVRGWFK